MTDYAKLIYAKYKELNDAEPRRKHLGASSIGKECQRDLQLSYRWAAPDDFDGRLLRLFEAGNAFEPRIIAELESIGFKVTGEQSNLGDKYLSGSCDGMMDDMILEMKTHGEKSFKDVEKKGVLASKPQHYSQMQAYMGYTGKTKALYIAENKNTSHLYFEEIEFDEKHFNGLKELAERVITSNELLPQQAGASETFFSCKWCNNYKICHQDAVPQKSCRTCMHWDHDKCRGHEIPDEVLFTGCGNHIYHPMFAPWEPLRGDDEWIIYNNSVCNAVDGAFPTIDDGEMVAMLTSDQIFELGAWSRLNNIKLIQEIFGNG